MPALADVTPPLSTPSLFQTVRASDALLLGLKPDGAPERSFWDARQRLSRSQSGPGQSSSLFRLTTATLPAIPEKRKAAREATTAATTSTVSLSREAERPEDGTESEETSTAQTTARTGASEVLLNPEQVAIATREQKRAGKYFDLLMKHHAKLADRSRKEKDLEEKERRENAANLSQMRTLHEEQKLQADGSDSEGASPEPEGDFGPLTEYAGAMKVDLEVVVLGAPKQRKKKRRYREIRLANGLVEYEAESYTPSTGSLYSASSSSRTSSAAPRSSSSSASAPSSKTSSADTPRMDIAAELEALHDELGSSSSSDSGSDGLPDELKDKGENPWENPNLRWQLGIGGTLLFVPDAERYGHAPSLPPPPPRSLHGRKRVHVKPRLPLDISNHRYRDEHPNVWPEDAYSPQQEERKAFEDKLMTLDFYASCSRSMTRLPPLEVSREAVRHEVAFGHLVERDTRHSYAWKCHLEKERRRKKREAQRRTPSSAAQLPFQGPVSKMAQLGQGHDESTTIGDPNSIETLPQELSDWPLLEASRTSLLLEPLASPEDVQQDALAEEHG